MYIIKVLVQLPDGSRARLPIIKYVGKPNSEYEVVKSETKYDAECYANYILPDRVEFWEE